MKPIIIRVFLRNSSVAYKKKKMLEAKVKQTISWSDFINICVDQLFTKCSLTGVSQGPTAEYLNNYDFYVKKEVIKEDIKENNEDITEEVIEESKSNKDE